MRPGPELKAVAEDQGAGAATVAGEAATAATGAIKNAGFEWPIAEVESQKRATHSFPNGL